MAQLQARDLQMLKRSREYSRELKRLFEWQERGLNVTAEIEKVRKEIKELSPS